MPKNPKSPRPTGRSKKPTPPAVQLNPSAASPKNSALPQFISVDDAAKSLGMSAKTVRRRIRNGILPARRSGRRVLISKADYVLFASTLPPVT